MTRRIGAPGRDTAARQFAAIQRDPTRPKKATRRYARGQRDIADRMAITAIIERYAVEATGALGYIRNDGVAVVRHARRTKGNGLAAWVIAEYERLRRRGLNSADALSRLSEDEVCKAVDSGRVGRWCASLAEVRKNGGKVSEAFSSEENGPRKAAKRAKRAKWAATRKAREAERAAEMEGLTFGVGEATTERRKAEISVMEKLRAMGIEPTAL